MVAKQHTWDEIPAYTSETILSGLFGLNQKTVNSLCNKGILPAKTKEGLPFTESVQKYINYLKASDLQRPIDRLNNAKADIAELDLAIKRGKYIPTDDVKTANAQIYTSLVESIRQLSDKLPQLIFPNPEDGQQEICAEIIRKAGDDVLENMATNLDEKFNV